jgi:hypothetical protein
VPGKTVGASKCGPPRVSAATIVNCFGDKRDLLNLLFNEDHRLVSD